MATIGTFTKANNGNFTGTITTAALKLKATIRPVDGEGDKAPDYRFSVGTAECGAGWQKTSREGRDYISSSWTIRPSRLRSTPPWSRATLPANTPLSGHADRPRRPANPSGAFVLLQSSD